MRLLRAPALALAALFAAHCSPAPVSNEGSRSESNPQPTASEPSGKLVRLARIEGYANPITGEMWMRGVEPRAPDAPEGVGVSASALAERPGFCEVTTESDGNIGGNENPSFEWFTWGTVDPAERLSNSDSSVSGAECWGHVDPLISDLFPQYENLYNQGALCFRQRLGNYTDRDFDRVYLDIDEFTGDPVAQVPFPPGFGDGLVPGPAFSFAPEFPEDALRNAPSSDFGLWDFGPVADGEEIDMWMFFQNRATTDYRWSGYLIGQVHEDCDDTGDPMDDDDDCDGVINNGCGEFDLGEACFVNDDCGSGTCEGMERAIVSEYGAAGGELIDPPAGILADVPGVCLSGLNQVCRYNEDCAEGDPWTLVCEAVVCVHDGQLRFVLEWPENTDFDLYVRTPQGNVIFWGASYQDGGYYDFDNLGAPVSGSHVENVYFPTAAPQGTYEFWAENGGTEMESNFQLIVYEGAIQRVIRTGTLDLAANMESQHYFFDFPAAVAMPPADLVLGQNDFMSNVAGSSANNLASPEHVAVDPVSRMVFVSDTSNNRVLRYDDVDALMNGADATMVFGQTTLNGISPGTGMNQLNLPQGIAIDGTRLWVVDRGNNRVLRFENASGLLSNGPAADGVLGAGLTIPSQVSVPSGIATLGGAIWVAEDNRNRVLRWDSAFAKANNAVADSVLGQASLSTVGQGSTAATMFHPAGLSIQPDGTLWVADQGNNRVLRFPNAPSAAIGAAAASVLGQLTFGATAPGSAVYQLNNVGGVAAAANGWVYVFDSGNNRIQSFAPWNVTQNGPNARHTTNVEGRPFFSPSQGFHDIVSDSLWAVDRANNRVLRYGGAAPGCGGGWTDANQLGGTAPDVTYMYLSRTQAMGQIFMIESTGTLSGIEVSVNTNALAASAFDTLHMDVMRGPHLIAQADIPSSAISQTETVLSASTLGPMFFALGANCPAVTSGETLRYELTLQGVDRGVCNLGNSTCTMGKVGAACISDESCEATVNFTLDYDSVGMVNPYMYGTATINGSAITNESGRFKVVVGP